MFVADFTRRGSRLGDGTKGQQMKVSSTRNELVIIAVVLVILIALAATPAFWGTAFGQKSKTNNGSVQTCALEGTVSTSSGRGQEERLPGASVDLVSTGPEQLARSAVTNEQGEYKFTNVPPGLYALKVVASGFKEHAQSVTLRDTTTLQPIVLQVADVSASVTVVADGDGLNTSDTTPSVSFHQNKLETLPLVNERFQDAIPLVPGVVRGPDGMLNLNGARSSQSGMIVNSANVKI